MAMLPRVTEKSRELIAREFDARGPDVCMTEIVEHLRRHNPELLDMAAKWAADLDDPHKAMLGFGMFYRLLMPVPFGAGILTPLPRVSEETRARLGGGHRRKGTRGLHLGSHRGTRAAQSGAPSDGAQLCFAPGKLPSGHAGFRAAAPVPA